MYPILQTGLVLLKIAVVLVVLDYGYLSLVGKKFANMIQSIQNSPLQLKLVPAALCYLAITVLVYYFLVRPRRSVPEAFLLGVCVYGIYDTTNVATIQKWNPTLAWIDTLWGGVLFALTRWIV